MASDMDLDNAPPALESTFDDGDDEIVAEMDVYSCGGVLPASSQSYLLQFPQRPQDRPYEGIKDVRFKPKVKRMQWDVALDTTGPTYNRNADPAVRMASFTLQSDRVDPGVQGLAVGMRRGDKLYLIPVQEVLQLRHSPAYLDKEKEKEVPRRGGGGGGTDVAGPSEPRDGGGASELLPITVQVKKHETEQQTEARLRSYAYHSQQEEADSWVKLEHHAAGSARSQAALDALPRGADRAELPAVTHTRGTYLDAITPGTSAVGEGQGEGANAATAGGGVGVEVGVPAASLPGSQLTSDALAALPGVLRTIFQNASVLSLENLRDRLQKHPTSGTINRAAETASDAVLHSAVMQAGDFVCIRKTYALRQLGNPAVDPLRTAVLELLKEKEQLKRGDVFEIAGLQGMTVSDALYQKVMKELCTSRGSTWVLKTGGA